MRSCLLLPELVLGHAACMRGYSAIYVKTNRLLPGSHRRLVVGDGHADGTWETRLKKYILADPLGTSPQSLPVS